MTLSKDGQCILYIVILVADYKPDCVITWKICCLHHHFWLFYACRDPPMLAATLQLDLCIGITGLAHVGTPANSA